MEQEKYYKQRVADQVLKRKLQTKGAVLIEGPKWCGKTTTAKQIANSVLDLGDSSVLEESAQMIQILPKKLLSGNTPRLLDEWQVLPQLWDMVRSEVDNRGSFGQFILTGSSVPVDPNKLHHSGTGRYGRLKMRPMSLWESGESAGNVSLLDLFQHQTIDVQENDMTIDELAFLLCRGGWPQATLLNTSLALDEAKDYYEAIYKVDIHRVDNVRRNSDRTRLLLRTYARNQGAAVSFSKLSKDIVENDNSNLSYETISDYVDALKKIFVIEDLPAWNPNLRSKTAIQTSDTRYFIDPSIATAALSVSPNDLLNDLRSFGLFFETMAVRDLRVYADALDGEVMHFRSSDGLECDAVLHLRNGQYVLVEIKLGGADNIEKGAASLLTLSGRINTDKMQAPSFLMVLTGVEKYAYQRKDGVWVIPIACLKP